MKNIRNNIFREFRKENEFFIGLNKFYVYEENELGSPSFHIMDNNNNECIVPYDNDIYVSKNNSKVEKYIDLILLSNISLSLEEIYIGKSELIKMILQNDDVIDEKLFEDLYYNEEFSKKINIELPQKYNNKKVILEDIEIKKRYLFKINFIELNKIFYQYKE